ncbi:MAG TPA: ATP synthase F1 subunit delta [Thermoanaerobaculia bacterium]|nr:ATP synthase F1 subunit delta [Thermoanaerobaculia bacterium]
MSRFARPYAQAFLETAPAGFDVEAFLERASVLSRALAADRRLKAFLAAPSLPVEAKRDVLDDLAGRVGIDDFGQRFLRLVLDNRRILALDEILGAIREARDRQLGIVEAFVTVAAPLADGERARIEQALARQLKRHVRMRVQVDPNILAGFVARVGSEVFDASVLRAIERFHVEAATAG